MNRRLFIAVTAACLVVATTASGQEAKAPPGPSNREQYIQKFTEVLASKLQATDIGRAAGLQPNTEKQNDELTAIRDQLTQPERKQMAEMIKTGVQQLEQNIRRAGGNPTGFEYVTKYKQICYDEVKLLTGEELGEKKPKRNQDETNPFSPRDDDDGGNVLAPEEEETFAEAALDYAENAFEFAFIGEYSGATPSIGGFVESIAAGVLGLDIQKDILDLSHDIHHWETSWSHVGTTALDAVALLPLIGTVKNINNVKYTDEIHDEIRAIKNVALYDGLIDAKAQKHILDSDKFGGGHRPGLGMPGKSEFPQGWSDEKILNEIADVATDPKSIVTKGRDGRSIIEGTRDGIDIRVVTEPPSKGGRIVTGYPTNVPRNPPAPRSR